MSVKKIDNMSESVRNIILRKSAYGLPLRPSASGMKAADIKKAFYSAITDEEDSIVSELKRIIREANEILVEIQEQESTHEENKSNPHNVTKEQVGLGSVDNTSDADKPISNKQASEFGKKVNYTDIIDSLTSNEVDKPLSASQGKILKDLIDGSLIDIKLDSSTGVLTIKKSNGESFIIDLPLEYLVKDGYYDADSKSIILVLDNNTTLNIPVEALVNEYFADGSTISLSRDSSGKLVFSLSAEYKHMLDNIPDGVVIEDNLESDKSNHGLSARQGKVLSEKISEMVDEIGDGLPTINYHW